MAVVWTEAELKAAQQRGVTVRQVPARGKPKNAAEAAAKSSVVKALVRGAQRQKAALPATTRPQATVAPKAPRKKTPPKEQVQRAAAEASERQGKKQVDYADLFHELLTTYAPDLLPVVAEFKFAEKLPKAWKRLWRFDGAWPVDPENPFAGGVAVEIDGGNMAHGGGRHGSDGDKDKLNLANSLGWRVIRFSPGQLRRDPLTCFAVIRLAMGWVPGLDEATAPALPSAWTAEARKALQAEEKAKKEARALRKQERINRGLIPLAPPKRSRKKDA